MTTTSPARTRDAHGNEISGAAEMVAGYDHALDRLLRYHPDLVPAAGEIASEPAALADGPGLPGLPPSDVVGRRGMSRGPERLAADWRRMPHGPAGDRPTAGDRRVGRRATGTAPPACSTTCSSSGRPTCSRCRSATCSTSSSATPATCETAPGRSLPPSIPRTRTPRSCAACRRSGSRSRPLRGRRGRRPGRVDRNPDDVWAIHAVIHAYEMRGTGRQRHPFLTRPGARLGHRQPVHGPQLVAPRALPPRGGATSTRCSPSTTARSTTTLGGRPARDARRQPPCCGGSARRGRHRRPVRAARRRVGDRRTTPARGTCSTTCTP